MLIYRNGPGRASAGLTETKDALSIGRQILKEIRDRGASMTDNVKPVATWRTGIDVLNHFLV